MGTPKERSRIRLSRPFISHSCVREGACVRCHFQRQWFLMRADPTHAQQTKRHVTVVLLLVLIGCQLREANRQASTDGTGRPASTPASPATSNPTALPVLSPATVTAAVLTQPSVKIPTPDALPPLFSGSSLVYDEAREEVVSFGGLQASPGCVFCDVTWVWDDLGWKQRHPKNIPPGRVGAGFVYDQSIRADVLFGGMSERSGSGNIPLNDTWLWDGENWIRQDPPVSPPARYGTNVGETMVYDAARQVVMLFGGEIPVSARAGMSLNDTWTWNGRTWIQLRPEASPPAEPGTFISAAYDAAHENVILLDQGTWTWDGTNWTERHPTLNPIPVGTGVMGYDPAHGRIVFFTFDPSTGEGVTWLWDGEDWSKADMNPQITGVEQMVYDSRHQVLLLFAVGGDKLAGFYEALWGWNGSAWDRVY